MNEFDAVTPETALQLWQQGFEVGEKLPGHRCPFPAHSLEAHCWLLGWEAGVQKSIGRPPSSEALEELLSECAERQPGR